MIHTTETQEGQDAQQPNPAFGHCGWITGWITRWILNHNSGLIRNYNIVEKCRPRGARSPTIDLGINAAATRHRHLIMTPCTVVDEGLFKTGIAALAGQPDPVDRNETAETHVVEAKIRPGRHTGVAPNVTTKRGVVEGQDLAVSGLWNQDC